MSRRNQNLYDGIGTWKRRPIRASKKTYMPSHKRWGKITVTRMPTPEGIITGSEIWTAPTPTEEILDVVEEVEEEEVVKE